MVTLTGAALQGPRLAMQPRYGKTHGNGPLPDLPTLETGGGTWHSDFPCVGAWRGRSQPPQARAGACTTFNAPC